MLDTTLSGLNANSYLTLIEADQAYEGNPFFGETWISLSDPQKEYWLKSSTRALDRMFLYKGHKAVGEQALQFPRKLYRGNPMRAYVHESYDYYAEEHAYFDPSRLHPQLLDALLDLTPMLYREQASTESGTIEGREEESISILNGLAKIEYKDRKSSEKLSIVAGSTVQSIKSLMRPWIRSARVVR